MFVDDAISKKKKYESCGRRSGERNFLFLQFFIFFSYKHTRLMIEGDPFREVVLKAIVFIGLIQLL